MATKRKLSLLILMLVLALVAAACGGDGETPAEGDGEGDTPAATGDATPTEGGTETPPAETPTEVEVGTVEGETELTFWTFVPQHGEFLLDAAERFNEENPDNTVALTATSIGYDQMHDQLLIALQTGTGAPDIVDIEISKFATFTRGDVQLHDLSDVVEPHAAELVEERLAPYMVEGVPYGIDYHLGAYLMYYNTEITDAAGIDIDAIETWDDYIEAGLQLKEQSPDIPMATVETAGPFTTNAVMLLNGGGRYNENNELILDSPENAEALQMVQDMIFEHEIAVPAPGTHHHDPAFFESFNGGGAASMWMPQWYMIRFPDNMPDLEGKMKVRPMPAFEAGGPVTSMGGGTGTAITNQIAEENVQVAKDFLGFAKLTEEAQIRLWTVLGFDPFRSDAYEDASLQENDPFFGDEPVMQTIAGMFDRLVPEYTGPRYPEITTEINGVIAPEVFVEQADPAEVLARTREQIESLD